MFAAGEGRKDYYAILGISKTATLAEIKAAFRKKALKVHPDRNPHITDELMKELNEAFEILSDPSKRARYDRRGDATPTLKTPPAKPTAAPAPAPSSARFFRPSTTIPKAPPEFKPQPAPEFKPQPQQPPLKPATLADTLEKISDILREIVIDGRNNQRWQQAKAILTMAGEGVFSDSAIFKCAGMAVIGESKPFLLATLTYLLTANSKGLKYLLDEPLQQQKISSKALNEIIKQPNKLGVINHFSPLSLMTVSYTGLKLLYRSTEFLAKITAEGLNCKVDALISNQESAPIYLQDDYAFNFEFYRGCENFSPLYWLSVTDQGQAILYGAPSLCHKITAEGLNRTILQRTNNGVKETGLSPAYWLMATEVGREILLRSEDLRKLINQHAINCIISFNNNQSHSSHAAHEGKTGAFWLLNTKTGQKLLDMDDGFLRQQTFYKGQNIGNKPMKWMPTTFHQPPYDAEKTGYHHYHSKSERVKHFFRRK